MGFLKVVIRAQCILFLGILLLYPFSSLFAAGIKIISPSDGTVVHSGETVAIVIEVLDSNIGSVLLASPAGVKKFQCFPASCDIVIPEGVLGPISIVATGKDSDGEFFSDKITLNSQPLAVLESINVSPDKIYFDWPNKNVQLTVKGTYADGKAYYITPADMGTIYASSDSLVATVDENGLVISKGNGKCTIAISNSGTSIDVPIEVSMPEIIQAVIDSRPKSLYLKSKEKYITCHIELPQGYNPQDINIESIALNEAVSCESNSAVIDDYNNNGISDLLVKFNSQDLGYFVERGEQVSVAISGEVGDRYFRGTDIIKVFNEAPTVPFSQFSLKHWRIHWDQGKHDKNKFQLSGRIDLPDDYTLDMLQKKGVVSIAIEKNDSAPFSQTATLDFKQHGPVWHYKVPKTQNGTEPLDIEKMLIFWQPEGSEGKPDKQGHAGKGHGKRAGWFMIQGNINISDADQALLLPKATLTLNIPVENITTAGSLESSASVDFTVNQNRWFYKSPRPCPGWKDNWWDKIEEDKKD